MQRKPSQSSQLNVMAWPFLFRESLIAWLTCSLRRMTPRLFALLCLTVIGVLPGAAAQRSVLSSEAELRKMGVFAERLQLETPMASIEIGALIDRNKLRGQY